MNLNGTRITDAGLVHLSGLTNLRDLWLTGTGVGLTGTGVTDAGLVHLSGLKKLEVLDLDGTGVTDSGLTSDN